MISYQACTRKDLTSITSLLVRKTNNTIESLMSLDFKMFLDMYYQIVDDLKEEQDKIKAERAKQNNISRTKASRYKTSSRP